MDDIFVWPDGTWCYRDELEQVSHMSDDTTVLVYNTNEYRAFLAELPEGTWE